MAVDPASDSRRTSAYEQDTWKGESSRLVHEASQPGDDRWIHDISWNMLSALNVYRLEIGYNPL
eukprot:16434487-Heterocapsa_arctica.AAC.1